MSRLALFPNIKFLTSKAKLKKRCDEMRMVRRESVRAGWLRITGLSISAQARAEIWRRISDGVDLIRAVSPTVLTDAVWLQGQARRR